MSGNADASDVEAEELSIGRLTRTSLKVHWLCRHGLLSRGHLELRVEDLSTKLAVVMSTMAALITNPEHTQSPSFYKSYCHVVATYDELSEHCAISSVADRKRRRLTPQSSLK